MSLADLTFHRRARRWRWLALAPMTLLVGCLYPIKLPGRGGEAATSKFDSPPVQVETAAASNDALVSDTWTMTTGEAARDWGWRQPSIEAQPPDARTPEALHAALTDSRIVVRGNAAILLAREGDATVVPQLVEVIGSVPLKLSMRRAALEALARLPAANAGRALESLGDALTASSSAPELHADYLTALARHVSPAQDARFVEGLQHASPDVRLAAVQAWDNADREGTVLPAKLAALRSDVDARVRAAALTTLARHHHPNALAWLRAMLYDTRLDVRLSSVRALGLLGSTEARDELDKLAHSDSEHIRAAVVEARLQCEDWNGLGTMAADPNWVVRAAVARATRDMPSDLRGPLAKKLVVDPSSEVQKALLTTLEQWPLDEAGPVLLISMERGGYRTRRVAAEQLTSRWPPAASFEADATSDQQRATLAELRRQWKTRLAATK